MESELARETTSRRDFKTGRGGLLDVESVVQYLQLRHAVDHPELIEVRTVAEQLALLTELGLLDTARADAFSMNAAQMTAGLVRSIHRRGAEVHVWTVNDQRLALRMIEMGVDNLITDRPGEMRRLLDSWEELADSEKVALQLRRLLLPNETFSTGEL